MTTAKVHPPDRLLADPALAVFEGLTKAEMCTVIEHSSILRLPAGSYIQRRGHRTEGLMVLLQGIGRITIEPARSRTMTLALPTRGALLGEACLQVEGGCCYNVLCVDDCILLSIQKENLFPLLRHVPALGRNLLVLSCANTTAWASRAELVPRADASHKVAAIILELAAAYGIGPPESVTVGRHIPQQVLAELTGLSRTHSYRGFVRLRKDGSVKVSGKRRLFVCDVPRLRSFLTSSLGFASSGEKNLKM